MPILLTTHAERVPERRFVETPSRLPAWQLLHREADRVYPELRTVWAILFAEMQTAIDVEALEAALARGGLLEAEALLTGLWQRVVDVPARAALPVLLRETVVRTAEAMLPETTAVVQPSIAIAFNVTDSAVLTAIDTYVGTQIRGISQQTLLGVRGVIREGFVEGKGVASMARQVRTVIGLTPRQVRAVQGLDARLQAEGKPPSVRQRAVTRATQQALARRATVIARTEAIYAASSGQYQLWLAADRQGVWDHTRMRRAWIVTPGERTCPRCRAIPGLNPNGVGLYEAFRTRNGTVLHPPEHPACRCACRSRVVAPVAQG